MEKQDYALQLAVSVIGRVGSGGVAGIVCLDINERPDDRRCAPAVARSHSQGLAALAMPPIAI